MAIAMTNGGGQKRTRRLCECERVCAYVLRANKAACHVCLSKRPPSEWNKINGGTVWKYKMNVWRKKKHHFPWPNYSPKNHIKGFDVCIVVFVSVCLWAENALPLQISNRKSVTERSSVGERFFAYFCPVWSLKAIKAVPRTSFSRPFHTPLKWSTS